MGERKCDIPGCEKPLLARGWCGMHYHRWWANGSPYALKQVSKGAGLVWLKHALKSWDRSQCWEWPFARQNQNGYGMVRVAGRLRTASSVALEIDGGSPRPAGMDCLHSCDNPPCCNPAHLRWGTVRDNVEDMYSRGRGKLGLQRNHTKLSDAAVLVIRQDSRPNSVVAAAYGVGPSHISRIKNGLARARLGGG